MFDTCSIMPDHDVEDSEETALGLEVWNVNVLIVEGICPVYFHPHYPVQGC